jgi:serine phosphatase RsbU (regulator of sigma subunit)
MIAVVDGLGHGPGAAEAADTAISHLKTVPVDGEPAEILKDLHGRLRATRGAAISICRIEKDRGLVRCAGVGNVAVSVLTGPENRRSLPTNNGTIGHSISRIQEFSCPVNKGDLLVVHSDGLISNWELPKWPGLFSRTPALIAALLCCKNRRERDDATVVVRRLGLVA